MLLKQNCSLFDLYFDDIKYKKSGHTILPEEDCGNLRRPGVYLTHLATWSSSTSPPGTQSFSFITTLAWLITTISYYATLLKQNNSWSEDDTSSIRHNVQGRLIQTAEPESRGFHALVPRCQHKGAGGISE